MKLVRLTPEAELDGFDCGDEDLNNFLVEDAKGLLDKRIATSYILEDCGSIVAYFCLLNDKISRQDVTNSQWKKIKGASLSVSSSEVTRRSRLAGLPSHQNIRVGI